MGGQIGDPPLLVVAPVQAGGSEEAQTGVKPVLSDKQKRDRVGFALSHLHRKGGARVVVDDMYDWVHVDEKWFYVMKDGRGIYLHPEEDAPK
ncbi:unnamed protein product, partial [Discosporangium mesarthrocarpum]